MRSKNWYLIHRILTSCWYQISNIDNFACYAKLVMSSWYDAQLWNALSRTHNLPGMSRGRKLLKISKELWWGSRREVLRPMILMVKAENRKVSLIVILNRIKPFSLTVPSLHLYALDGSNLGSNVPLALKETSTNVSHGSGDVTLLPHIPKRYFFSVVLNSKTWSTNPGWFHASSWL